mmetsp:Transcript_29235/g.69411  ORF Transcript_29235/g.69411 Transcript_29235/m.69411 type:complete len:123 (+) Transcript_29235:705-1073(+)
MRQLPFGGSGHRKDGGTHALAGLDLLLLLLLRLSVRGAVARAQKEVQFEPYARTHTLDSDPCVHNSATGAAGLAGRLVASEGGSIEVGKGRAGLRHRSSQSGRGESNGINVLDDAREGVTDQ